MNRHVMFAAALICALACMRVSPASAALVSLVHDRTEPGVDGPKASGFPPRDVYTLRLVDDGSEDNRFVLGVARVRDDGAPLRLGVGCHAGSDGGADCDAVPTAKGNLVSVLWDVQAGGGNDRLEGYSGFTGTATLGTGDDEANLRCPCSGTVEGGAGADAIRGTSALVPSLTASSTDALNILGAQSGGRVIWTGGAGPDRAAGEAIAASYTERTGPVSVTPGNGADDGEPGEGDDVALDIGTVFGGAGDDALIGGVWGASGGAGNDVITGRDLDAPRFQSGEALFGGPGADLISAGAGNDELDGGPGDDRLDGGPGDDKLKDGDGSDQIDGGAGSDAAETSEEGHSADTWIGGDGADTLQLRTGTVTIDGQANDGVAGERDNVHMDWESIEMERGRLIGSDAGEVLRMADRGFIDGRGGNDYLSGGSTVIGGAGRDTLGFQGDVDFDRRLPVRIDVRDGERDVVECEASVRLLRDAKDRITGCFSIAIPKLFVSRRRLTPDRRVLVPVKCQGLQACRGRLIVRTSWTGRTLTRVPFRIAAGSLHRVPIQLGRRVSGLRKRCGNVWMQAITDSPFRRGDDLTYAEDESRLGIPDGAPSRCRARRRT